MQLGCSLHAFTMLNFENNNCRLFMLFSLPDFKRVTEKLINETEQTVLYNLQLAMKILPYLTLCGAKSSDTKSIFTCSSGH